MKKMAVSIISALAGAAIGAGATGKAALEKNVRTQSMSDKHLALFRMMNQWVRVKQEGKNLAEYLQRKGYKNIAVYGMSYAGETLVSELKDTDVRVVYGIDQNADSICVDIHVVSPGEDLTGVDAVVVTAVTFFDEIEDMLSGKLDCPILSLEDILYDI